MSIPVLKLNVKLSDLTVETHPEYGQSYTLPVSGKAGFKSSGINVETSDGKLLVMRTFNRKTDEVDSNGKAVYVVGVSFKDPGATLKPMLKSELEKALSAAQEGKAALEARLAAMEQRFAEMSGVGSFKTSAVKVSK